MLVAIMEKQPFDSANTCLKTLVRYAVWDVDKFTSASQNKFGICKFIKSKNSYLSKFSMMLGIIKDFMPGLPAHCADFMPGSQPNCVDNNLIKGLLG